MLYSIRMFPVTSDKAAELAALMAKWGLREDDIDESFIRSGGHGGQNVNKVSSCVVLTHRPSGLTVRCERERSQGMNRFIARRLLCEKMELKIMGAKAAAMAEREKLRRQKRKRSKRAKAKMVEAKRHRGAIKAGRQGKGWD